MLSEIVLSRKMIVIVSLINVMDLKLSSFSWIFRGCRYGILSLYMFEGDGYYC
jgi:hypothetical protein